MFKIKMPSRLIATTILMSLILVLVVFIIIGLIDEKVRIQSALELSQKNRELILKTEGVTESLLLVEVRFKEYCTTFEKPVFEDYKTQVKSLAENIKLLQQTVSDESLKEGSRVTSIFQEKNKEADIYAKLSLITDSLMFSFGSLEENQTQIKNYIGSLSKVKVDTLSVTETRETNKKGLLGKIKTAIVGEKIQENVETKLLVNTQEELKKLNQNPSQEQIIEELQVQNSGDNSPHIRALIQKVQELKNSELKLIKLNNSLIAEIRKLINEIKANIKNQEAKQNNSFLNSVRNSTDFLQSILIVLMILACILAVYILVLAYKNNKFQNSIIDLNKKVMKDTIEKDKFYSIVSHDIMNPFNALLGFSKILKDAVREGDQKEIEECSTIVHQSANRISNLLQNLLVWSRVQNGKLQFSPKSCSINQLVSETIAIITPIAKNKNIKLDWNVKDEIKAEIDQNMISSVLQNLITNAIKFTERGGQVTISAFSESDKLNFIVSDTGLGINEEQLQKLFKLDKATSSRGTDDETGTGLGLIISKEFIEKHQGQIWAESTPGKGSKFCFTIPNVL